MAYLRNIAENTIGNKEWAFRPSSNVAFSCMVRLHRFGYVEPASAHLLLPEDIQEQYLVDIARMAEEGMLRSVQTGHLLQPYALKGWLKSSPDRLNSGFTIDEEQPGHCVELVDHFYNQ